MIKKIIVLLIVVFVMITNNAAGQPSGLSVSEDDTLKVGLVLSGGGALGIAHIGVLEAIEEAGLRIDYITGTSMGSLVGGLYSIGYTSEQLVEIVESNNFMDLFTEDKNRRYVSNYERPTEGRTIASFPIEKTKIDLPLGILSGQNVYTFLSRLTWNVHGTESFDNFPIPFRAIGTDLETGEAVTFDSGYLPDALRASISIPSVFEPHKIGDKVYIDGGLIRNIPVEDAIDMGANYTIAVDVSSDLKKQDSLNTLGAILNQTVQFRVEDYAEKQKELADLNVEVDELDPFDATDFDRAVELLEMGRQAGKRYLDKFKELAAMQTVSPQPRDGIGEFGSLPIGSIEINGNSIYTDEFVIQQLDFSPETRLNPDIIEDRITRLYSSQYIDLVTYRIMPNDAEYNYTLQINIEENTQDKFNVGLRYETITQASILLEADFQNLLHNGSINRFEARLGDRIHFAADHLYYGALGSQLALLTTLSYESENIDWYNNGERTSRFKNQVLRGELAFGNYYSIQNLFEIGLRKDFMFRSDVINPDSIKAAEVDYHSVFARFTYDRLNRRSYPTKGEKVLIEGTLSDEVFLSPVNFFSTSLYYEGFYPVSPSFSITNTVWAGYSLGDELPWEYWFSPNRFRRHHGEIRFAGVDRYQISKRNIQTASLGFQAEPIRHRFIGFDVYAGRFLDDWSLRLDMDDIETGYSITVGALTILGPVKAIFSNGSTNNYRFELQIGHRF
jgi:NTE family protein